MASKIICITGPEGVAQELALKIHAVFVSMEDYATIMKVGHVKAIEPTSSRACEVITLVWKVIDNITKPNVVILTGFPDSITEAGEFLELMKRNLRLPQEFFLINVVEEERELKNTVSLTADYVQKLLEGGKGASGTIVNDGTPQKLLIDALSLMAHFDQKVTIVGTAVSGKTTVTRGINEALGYELFSAGNDVTRVFAEKKGMQLDDVVKHIQTNKEMAYEYDTEVDDWNKKIITGKTKFVLECRLGALWAAETKTKAFNVLLEIDKVTAGIRLYDDIVNNPQSRRKQLAYASLEDATNGTAERNELDRQRYKETYKGFDFTNRKHYHCVIDSVVVPKDQMVAVFMKNYIRFLVAEIG